MGKFSTGMPESGGGWFRIAEGNNRIRIVSDGTVFAEHFKQGGGGGVCYGKSKGCPNCKEGDSPTFKKLYRIINRKKTKDIDGIEIEVGMQLAKFGNVIIKQLDALADNEDYSFDTFPMPYDVTINAVGAGDKSVKYSIVPSPKRTELTDDEAAALSKEHGVSEIVASMKNKRMKADGNAPAETEETQRETKVDYPNDDIDPADIPF